MHSDRSAQGCFFMLEAGFMLFTVFCDLEIAHHSVKITIAIDKKQDARNFKRFERVLIPVKTG